MIGISRAGRGKSYPGSSARSCSRGLNLRPYAPAPVTFRALPDDLDQFSPKIRINNRIAAPCEGSGYG